MKDYTVLYWIQNNAGKIPYGAKVTAKDKEDAENVVKKLHPSAIVQHVSEKKSYSAALEEYFSEMIS